MSQAGSEKKENCGLFGIFGDPGAVHKTYIALHSLQHRGQESAGIASSDGHEIQCYTGMGTVRRVFRRGSSALDKLNIEGDEAIGLAILKKAFDEPVRWIAMNAGKEGSVIVDAIRKSSPGVGYDAAKGEFGNMVEKGIIDPLKVTRTSLQNGASTAVMVLTTESLVTDIPEKEKPPMPPMPEY